MLLCFDFIRRLESVTDEFMASSAGHLRDNTWGQILQWLCQLTAGLIDGCGSSSGL